MPVGEIFLLFLALGESVAQVNFATWNWPSPALWILNLLLGYAHTISFMY